MLEAYTPLAPASPPAAPAKRPRPMIRPEKEGKKIEWPKSGLSASPDGDFAQYATPRSTPFLVSSAVVEWLCETRRKTAKPLPFYVEEPDPWFDTNPELYARLKECVFQEEGHKYRIHVGGGLYSDGVIPSEEEDGLYSKGVLSTTTLIKRLNTTGYNVTKFAAGVVGRNRDAVRKSELKHLSREEVGSYIRSAEPGKLKEWTDKFGSLTLKEAEATLKATNNRKAAYGTSMHAWIERFLKGEKPVPETPQHYAFLEYSRKPENHPSLTLYTEMTLSFPDLNLGGRVDYIGRFPGGKPDEIVIKDWKGYNSKNLVYKMGLPDWLQSMFPGLVLSEAELQLMLYQFYFERLFPHLKVVKLIIVYVFTCEMRSGEIEEKTVTYNDRLVHAVLTYPRRELVNSWEKMGGGHGGGSSSKSTESARGGPPTPTLEPPSRSPS